MKHLFNITVYIFLFMGSFSHLASQELLEEIPLDEQVAKASSVIEGKVISKKSYWDVTHQHIFTVNTFEVVKVFKGSAMSRVNVVTLGGVVGENSLTVTPSLSLNLNDVGLVTLEESKFKLEGYDISSGKLYSPYCTVQSFYKYDYLDDKAINSFVTILGISKFNSKIEQLTGHEGKRMSDLKKNNNLNKVASSNAVLAPSNINFSPSSIGAGAQLQLTITGSGFGSETGFVFFKDPDNGGRNFVSAASSDIVSWSDTRIVIEVPARAGTGTIRVQDSRGNEAESVNSLFIPYSLTNLGRSSAQHFDINGQGGLTWRINPDLIANKPAHDAVLRAIDTWRCETGINWVIGDSIDIDETINDDINVISFGDLPRGTLGITYVYGTTCDRVVFLITDVDVIMRRPNTVNWNFGPEPTTGFNTDFETTFLHELGHAHLLGHVINSADLMNFSITSGRDTRTLGAANINGADIIMDHSTTRKVCRGQDLIEPFVCPTNSLEDEVLNNAGFLRVYPNPNAGIFTVEGGDSLSLKRVVVFDVSGRLIKDVDLENVNSTTIDLLGASSGLYFVNIYFNNTVEVKKILVK